jgi:hypothetical protein
MGNLRVLILDSCSINTLHPDTFLNLGRSSTTNHQRTGLEGHSKRRSQMNIEGPVEMNIKSIWYREECYNREKIFN